MRIGICEDQAPERRHIQGLVEAWAKARCLPLEWMEYPTAEAFLFDQSQTAALDLLLLDIEMPGMDGIALARELRREDGAVQILFITGFPDFMAQGYEVDALHYLMKPVDPAKLTAALDKARQRLEHQEPIWLYEGMEGWGRIRHRDIGCVEALAHRARLYCGDGHALDIKTSFAQALRDLEGRAFVRCHRSYLVGLHQVERITKAGILLAGGLTVPLSRRMFHPVHRAFIDYYKEARP